MSLPIRTLADLGEAVRAARLEQGLKATHLAARAGRSRDLLHRLETGGEITTGALLAVLHAMNHTLCLQRLGLPTRDEVRERFAADDDDD